MVQRSCFNLTSPGRKKKATEGDLSGLTTLCLPGHNCDLKSEMIIQTGIESMFGRGRQINHVEKRGAAEQL